jgi:GcrA cell cycle regulator
MLCGGPVLQLVIASNVSASRLAAACGFGADEVGDGPRGEEMSWTDERVELLKKLWQDGLSASQIAAELGGVTRNAVIGKVHRLGLSGRGQPTSSIKRQRRTHSTGMRRVRQMITVGNLALKPDQLPDVDMRPRRNVVVPIALKLSIFQLTEKTCKWPIGDPGHDEFHFCGHDSLENLPYCEYHAGVAYQAPEPRRRLRR